MSSLRQMQEAVAGMMLLELRRACRLLGASEIRSKHSTEAFRAA